VRQWRPESGVTSGKPCPFKTPTPGVFPQAFKDDLSEGISRPCGRVGRASPVSELRSFPLASCVRLHPCLASLKGQRVRVRYTPGSDWQSRVYPVSAQTLPSRRNTLGQETPSRSHDTCNAHTVCLLLSMTTLAPQTLTSMHAWRVNTWARNFHV